MYARPARKNSRKALSATAADIAEDTAATEDAVKEDAVKEDAEKDTAVVKGTAAVRDTAVVKGTAERDTAAESARRRTITGIVCNCKAEHGENSCSHIELERKGLPQDFPSGPC